MPELSRNLIDSTDVTLSRYCNLIASAPDMTVLFYRFGSYTLINMGQIDESIPSYLSIEKKDYIAQIFTSKVASSIEFQVGGLEYEVRFVLLNNDELLGIIRDITEWKKREHALVDSLEKQAAELEHFVYAASHDLREPLIKIKSFGQKLQEDIPPNEKTAYYVDVMLSGAERLLKLLDSLLSYTKLGQKCLSLDVDLNEVIKNTLDSLYFAINDSKAVIEFSNLPTIKGDPNLLCFLFQNLIGNSIKFKKPGVRPIIKISSYKTTKSVIISVEDNGIGFESKYKERIFQMFERLQTRFEYPGTGVGLATCRKIMDKHCGSISANGQPGIGSIFTLTFPL